MAVCDLGGNRSLSGLRPKWEKFPLAIYAVDNVFYRWQEIGGPITGGDVQVFTHSAPVIFDQLLYLSAKDALYDNL